MKDVEIRSLPIEDAELRFEEGVDGKPTTIEGYALKFNSLSKPLPAGYVEVIRPGAFTRALESSGTVLATFNHKFDEPLARSDAKPIPTLSLAQDDIGLRFSFQIPNTTIGRDTIENMRNGNIGGCSFAFGLKGLNATFRKEGDQAIRELHEVPSLLDISVVTVPAYNHTEVSMRNFEEWKAAEETPKEEEKTPKEEEKTYKPSVEYLQKVTWQLKLGGKV